MASIFDIIPNNFFNPLSSNSNYRANAALFQFIYEQYDNEISYRIKRNILRDEMAYFISEHSEEFLADYDMSNKTCQDISSDYLRRFSSKDVGWLEEEFDESTFEKYIVITEQGVMLAELLSHLERPERDELSSYMYNIYNTLLNQDQWNGDPYVGALKNVYKNAKLLSKSLKRMSTYIRKTIEKLMKEISYESLTENIIAYCDGDFIKEYARLTKPQNNIHIYRSKIIDMLEEMQNDAEMYELITIGCVNEEDIEEWEAEEKIDLMFDSIKKFLKDDYLKIIGDIKHKLNLYITMALGRLELYDKLRIKSDNLSKKQGSASNGEKQTPYFIILAASLLQCYPKNVSCARLAFIDEAFSALSRERIEQMVRFFEDNKFQVIYAAPPEKIDSIGSHINSTISLCMKGKYTWAIEGLVKSDEFSVD